MFWNQYLDRVVDLPVFQIPASCEFFFRSQRYRVLLPIETPNIRVAQRVPFPNLGCQAGKVRGGVFTDHSHSMLSLCLSISPECTAFLLLFSQCGDQPSLVRSQRLQSVLSCVTAFLAQDKRDYHSIAHKSSYRYTCTVYTCACTDTYTYAH